MQTWRSSLAVSGSRTASSQVPCCKCIPVTSALVWPHAGGCSCMQSFAWHPTWEFWNHLCPRSAGSGCLHLIGLWCRGRCCLPVNASLLPPMTAVLGGSSKADYKVLQHPKSCEKAHRENVQSHTEPCNACLLRFQFGHAHVGKTKRQPEGFAGYRLWDLLSRTEHLIKRKYMGLQILGEHQQCIF